MKKSKLAFAGILSSLILLAGCGSNVPVLHVYTWADYIDPEVLADFEKEFSCSVAVDTFDSNEAMFAKLQAGSSGYDIITPTSYQIPLMAKSGMIRQLDKTLLPNVAKNFDKAYYAAILDKDMIYNVPYAVTYTGFAYRKDRIGDAPIDSWRIFETDALRGRMSLLSDMRETIGGALKYLGYSINTEDPKQIDEAAELVIKWKKNVAKFDNEQYKTAVASAEWFVGHGYSSDSIQITQDDENVGFVLPKEGFVIACDELVISKEAPNAELAHKFIDFFYRADIAKRNMEYVLAPMPVAPALQALDPEIKEKVVVSPELLKKGEVVIDFDGEKSAVRDLYIKAWDKIKATSSK
jgi:spermidine/putrescine transport system substrate-binding protein